MSMLFMMVCFFMAVGVFAAGAMRALRELSDRGHPSALPLLHDGLSWPPRYRGLVAVAPPVKRSERLPR